MMAETAVSNRTVGTMGALKREVGEFTMQATIGFEIQTKLGRIIWCQLISINSDTGDRSGPWFVNSNTTVNNVGGQGGKIHINNTSDAFPNASAYLYEVIGYG